MKRLLPLLAVVLILGSCKTSKDYLTRPDEDRTLFDVVKALNKRPDDGDASKALPVIYPRVQERHLNKISNYRNSRELSRWDKLIEEYSTLQKMYEAISNSGAASRLVTPANYQHIIYDLKQEAAEDYYQHAIALAPGEDRETARKAYSYLNKAQKYVPGYKDSKVKMTEAFENAVVNVVINPVQDNSFFFNTGWGNAGYNYSNEYFQQSLVRELGGKNNSRYPGRFYTDWEARRDNVQPDWTVDLTLRNMDLPRPSTYNYTRNVSKQVESGRDSSGRVIYQTVYATLQISRQSFNARGQMDVNITDTRTRKNISYNSYQDSYNWQQETARYSGDGRALSQHDWEMVNNSYYTEPRREEVLNEIYRKIYPQVKNRISYAVDW